MKSSVITLITNVYPWSAQGTWWADTRDIVGLCVIRVKGPGWVLAGVSLDKHVWDDESALTHAFMQRFSHQQYRHVWGLWYKFFRVSQLLQARFGVGATESENWQNPRFTSYFIIPQGESYSILQQVIRNIGKTVQIQNMDLECIYMAYLMP